MRRVLFARLTAAPPLALVLVAALLAGCSDPENGPADAPSESSAPPTGEAGGALTFVYAGLQSEVDYAGAWSPEAVAEALAGVGVGIRAQEPDAVTGTLEGNASLTAAAREGEGWRLTVTYGDDVKYFNDVTAVERRVDEQRNDVMPRHNELLAALESAGFAREGEMRWTPVMGVLPA